MRKYISLINIVVIIFMLISLSGCSSPEADGQQPITTTDGMGTQSEKTVISCTYNTEGESWIPPEKEVNEYLDSIGCDFAISFVPIGYIGGGIERLIEEGTPPDIVYTVCLEFEDQDMTVYNKLFYDNMYLCLDDYLYNTELGKKLYEAFPEKHWNELKINGGIYAIDGSLSSLTTNFGYLYDKKMVEKYGYDISLSPLKQLDRLNEIAKGENIVPFLLGNDFFLASGYTDSRRLAKGVVFDENLGRAISLLEDEEFLSNIETAYTLAQQGLADNDDRASHFAMRFFSSVNMQNGEPFEYQGKTVLPQMKNTPKMQSPISAIGIYKYSTSPDKAFEFLSLCMTDSVLNNLLTYGVEGSTCKVDPNGYVTKRWSGESSTICQFINRSIALPNTLERLIKVSREQYDNTMEKAEERPVAAGFAVNIDSVYNESQAVDIVLKEMSSEIFAIDKGLSFDDYLEKYKKKLNEAGLQTIVDEVNRQYEAFAKLNN